MGSPPASSSPAALQALGRTLHADATALEVFTAFQDDGLECLLLKGRSFAQWLYGPGEVRTYVDADILVDPRQVLRAEAILAALGFTHEPLDDIPHDKPWHAHSWVRAGDASSVDLHRTLIGADAEPLQVWECLSVRREPLAIKGKDLQTFDRDARALHVCLQAAQDGTRTPKAQEDLRRALSILPVDVWKAALELAECVDGTDAFGVGLRFQPEGRELADLIGVPRATSVSVALRAGDAPSTAVGLDWMLQAPGLVPKLRVLGRKVFPPVDFMRAWSPGARRSRSGLLWAYLWERPSWLLQNAAPSWRAWRRAHRHLRSKEGP